MKNYESIDIEIEIIKRFIAAMFLIGSGLGTMEKYGTYTWSTVIGWLFITIGITYIIYMIGVTLYFKKRSH